MIDTGATTTFVHENLLHHLKNLQVVSQKPYSFVLADGIAPFHVLGTVRLCIRFANVRTTIDAHIARNLCTDIILGMDYVNRYNLSFNVTHQTVSIEHKHRMLTINIDPEHQCQKISVLSLKSLSIPPNTSCSVPVSTSVSSICSIFIPNPNFNL